MESIIFFVIVMAINLVFKSVNDKKKIEEARRKRTGQLKNNPSTTREQESINKESENYNSRSYNYTIQDDESKKSTNKENQIERENVRRLEKEKQELKAKQLETQKQIKEGVKKERLINAIIWSEILGKPKSIQNLKKGM